MQGDIPKVLQIPNFQKSLRKGEIRFLLEKLVVQFSENSKDLIIFKLKSKQYSVPSKKNIITLQLAQYKLVNANKVSVPSFGHRRAGLPGNESHITDCISVH